MPPPHPCRDSRPGRVQEAAAALRAAVPGALGAALAAARELGEDLPAPGTGRTGQLWLRLAELARLDLSLARVVEPHLDALAILRQAGLDELADRPAAWGVWAAEAAGHELVARYGSGGWELTGTKAWCSLAAHLDRAVVTASTGGGRRRAFAADLAHPGVVPGSTEDWRPAGLQDVPTGDVRCTAVPAVPVGPDGWYLERPGFAWGGIGVAACWYGGAAGVADLLWEDAARTGARSTSWATPRSASSTRTCTPPARRCARRRSRSTPAGPAGTAARSWPCAPGASSRGRRRPCSGRSRPPPARDRSPAPPSTSAG